MSSCRQSSPNIWDMCVGVVSPRHRFLDRTAHDGLIDWLVALLSPILPRRLQPWLQKVRMDQRKNHGKKKKKIVCARHRQPQGAQPNRQGEEDVTKHDSINTGSYVHCVYILPYSR